MTGEQQAGEQNNSLAPTPEQREVAAQAMFPSMQKQGPVDHDPYAPDSVKELRKADGPRAIYTPQTMMAEALPDSLLDSEVAEDGFTTDQARAAVAAYREVATDIGFNANEVKELVQVFSAPVTDEEVAGEHSTSQKWLRDTYGNDADAVLKDAQKLVARDPRVKELLTATGLGSNPVVVRLFTQQARRLRLAGKL